MVNESLTSFLRAIIQNSDTRTIKNEPNKINKLKENGIAES